MPVSLPLRTARLLLEPMTEADAPAFAAYRSDPAVARYQSWAAPYPLDAARAALRTNPQAWPDAGEWLQLAMRAGDVLVGDVAVHPLDDPVQPDTVEVGITVAPQQQGRGYAAEGLGVVVDACLAGGVHRVVASTDARNEPVARLLTRIGFRREGRLVDAERWKGGWTTTDLWALLAGDRPG